jgi:hypothetical protein
MTQLQRKLDVVVTKQNTNGARNNAHAKSHTHLQFAPANAPPKIAKEYVLPTLTDKQDEKEHRSDNITYTQAGVSCFVGQESSKFKVQFFVGSSVVKIPACV